MIRLLAPLIALGSSRSAETQVKSGRRTFCAKDLKKKPQEHDAKKSIFKPAESDQFQIGTRTSASSARPIRLDRRRAAIVLLYSGQCLRKEVNAAAAVVGLRL